MRTWLAAHARTRSRQDRFRSGPVCLREAPAAPGRDEAVLLLDVCALVKLDFVVFTKRCATCIVLHAERRPRGLWQLEAHEARAGRTRPDF